MPRSSKVCSTAALAALALLLTVGGCGSSDAEGDGGPVDDASSAGDGGEGVDTGVEDGAQVGGDDASASGPTITIGSTSFAEGEAIQVVTFTVNLSAPAAATVTVDYATQDGTAHAGVDYAATSGSVAFAPGETTKVVSVDLNGDTMDEDDEVFTVALSNPSNALLAVAQAAGTILDDDAAPVLTIADATTAEGQAGATLLSFTVSLDAPSGKTITAMYASADGTAKTGGDATSGGQDYQGTTGVVSFAPGTTTQVVEVRVAGDPVNEPDETIGVTLASPTNASLGQAQGTGTIANDDAVPLVSVSSETSVEGNGGTTTFSFKVRLFDPVTLAQTKSGQTVTVAYSTQDGTALAPADYPLASGTITFQPGESSKVVNVAVVADLAAEPNEAFTVALSAPTNALLGVGTGTGTIVNDDGSLPFLNIEDRIVFEGNAGSQAVAFTVTLSAPSGQAVTVDYATESQTTMTFGSLGSGGLDYVTTSGTLTFAPGETEKTVSVTVNGDTANEVDETFAVRLSNASSNAALQDDLGVGTISNDDAAPKLKILDTQISEGDAGTKSMTFNVELSAASGRTVTVAYATSDGTATASGQSAAGGSDYTATSGTLQLVPGETLKGIVVFVKGDTTREGNETMTMTLSQITAATLEDGIASGTIVDEDPIPTLSVSDVTLAEGTPSLATITSFPFVVTLSNPRSVAISVDYATAGDTAFPVSDYTVASGTLTFLPGETTKTVTVSVKKDNTVEATEAFLLKLSNPTFATLLDAEGVGTIVNDDLP